MWYIGGDTLIDADEVEKITIDCFLKEAELVNGEPPEDTIIVEGIVRKYGFSPKKIKKYEARIIEMLKELPLNFRKNVGGGWSFLNSCNTKDDEQWTGLHLRMEQLMMLGMAIGKVKFTLPREMWQILPGGMPYFVIDVEE